MKKLLLILAMSVILTQTARAESLNLGDTLKKLPALNNGIGYSLDKGDVTYLSTIKVLEWKGVGINAGYSSGDKIIGSVSYNLLNLKDMGVKVPILDLVHVEPTAWIGFGSINTQALDDSELDFGVGINILSVSF